MSNVLDISNHAVRLRSKSQSAWVVDGINLTIRPGETVALVGESGCGKSVTALSIMRLLPEGSCAAESSKIMLDDKDLLNQTETEMQQIRGQDIGMVFQDPMMALNPVLRIRTQLDEVTDKDQVRNCELLSSMRIPDPERILDCYPHQLSGGMKQRIIIALALARRPKLLIADEPTTALDVTTQVEILGLIKRLQIEMNMAVLLITHDLGVVRQMADRIAVMYAGVIVEKQSVDSFFKAPRHPYAQLLMQALPYQTAHRQRIPEIKGALPVLTEQSFEGCRFASRCPKVSDICLNTVPVLHNNKNASIACHLYNENFIDSEIQVVEGIKKPIPLDPSTYEVNIEVPLMSLRDVCVSFPVSKSIFKRSRRYVHAVSHVSLNLYEDETLVLVGESGCGKSTLARTLVALDKPTTGAIAYMGRDMTHMSASKLRVGRSHFQMIFQDPFSAFNPRMRVRDILMEGMKSLKVGSSKAERLDRVNSLLEQVNLPLSAADKFPHEFSGGQRQRIGIARALAVGPKVIICDEPTSALDVSVQAKILNLLSQLQDDYGISYMLITHDMGVARHMADRIAVMYLGRIVESGPAEMLFNAPMHPYTQLLMDAILPADLDKKIQTRIKTTEMPNPAAPPQGCHFHPRCPKKLPICEQVAPAEIGTQHVVSCHLYR